MYGRHAEDNAQKIIEIALKQQDFLLSLVDQDSDNPINDNLLKDLHETMKIMATAKKILYPNK